MDFIAILETFGLPVFMVIALGWYVNRQNQFIQQDLTKEIEGLKQILITLINNSKKNEISLANLKGSSSTLINIFTKLIKELNNVDQKNIK